MVYEVVDGIDLFNQLPGWRLHLAHLALEPGSHQDVLSVAIKGTTAGVRRRYPAGSLDEDVNVLAVRDALRSSSCAGCAAPMLPELLALDVLAGLPFPHGHAAEQFRDILGLRTMLPWSVVDAGKVLLPLKFGVDESGATARAYTTEVDLKGRPALLDGRGVVASPCGDLDDRRVDDGTKEVLLICYTPMAVAREFAARTELARMVWMTWAFRFLEERAFLPRGDA